MTIGETIFDSENGLYECKFDIDKCHVGFGIGMYTVNNCDFMGYDHAIYFIKCDNDPSYPNTNMEFNDDSHISLSILLKEKSFKDSDIMKININFDKVIDQAMQRNNYSLLMRLSHIYSQYLPISVFIPSITFRDGAYKSGCNGSSVLNTASFIAL